LQICLYFAQESMISGIYVWLILALLGPLDTRALEAGKSRVGGSKLKSRYTRRVMKHLIYINIVLVLLDGALLATEFIGHYEVQTVFKVSGLLSIGVLQG
jgi:hypothetical protein